MKKMKIKKFGKIALYAILAYMTIKDIDIYKNRIEQKADPGITEVQKYQISDKFDPDIFPPTKENTSIIDNHKKDSEIEETELAKKIFKVLTKKDFPDFYKISKENEIKEGVAYHNSLNGRIVYKDMGKLKNLVNLLHEFGHVYALHHEKNPFSYDKNLFVLEEACAYAFENAGLDYLIKNSEGETITDVINLHDEFLRKTHTLAEIFSNGEEDKEGHCEGAALFLETLAVTGGPSETLNYLVSIKDSSLKNLNPKIKERIKEKYKRNI